MNWKTFGAMLARDAHVARRNAIQLFLQTFRQPLLFVFIFGRVSRCCDFFYQIRQYAMRTIFCPS